jgi:hypothetical protein
VGAAGLAAGIVTGALALKKKDTVDRECGIGGVETACTTEGKAAADEAKALATGSTIAFGVGALGVGTGVVLIVTASDAAGDARGPSAFAVSVNGRF